MRSEHADAEPRIEADPTDPGVRVTIQELADAVFARLRSKVADPASPAE